MIKKKLIEVTLNIAMDSNMPIYLEVEVIKSTNYLQNYNSNKHLLLINLYKK